MKNDKDALASGKKWFPYNKGGNQRRWYGNQTSVVNWENDGHEIKEFEGSVIRNPNYYFKPSLSWSDISSSSTGFKVYPAGFIFDVCGMSCFDSPDNINLLGVLNTKLFPQLIKILNPTMHFQIGNFKQLPYLHVGTNSFNKLVDQNITLSKLDWDAHETSWDFAENPLVAIMKHVEGEEPVVSKKEIGSLKPRNQQFLSEKPAVSKRETDSFAAENYCEQGEAEDDQAVVTPLPDCGNDVTKPWYDDYHAAVKSLNNLVGDTTTRDASAPTGTLEMTVNAFEKLWTARFMQLHANEEELNRQFIDIYGLQDELTPDVPLNEITILQQGEISIE